MSFRRFSYVHYSQIDLLLLRYVRLSAKYRYVLQCNVQPNM
ncbi:hypothetical protein ACVLD2_002585 [Paenibacillus sp. PvR052]